MRLLISRKKNLIYQLSVDGAKLETHAKVWGANGA